MRYANMTPPAASPTAVRAAQRTRAWRDARRNQGLVKLELWVPPAAKADIQAAARSILIASSRGKIEMTLAEEDGAEDKLIQSIVGEAVKNVFNRIADMDDYETITQQFQGNLTFPSGDDISAEEFVANMKLVKGLPQAATRLAKEMELDPNDSAVLASVGEFILGSLVTSHVKDLVASGQSGGLSESMTTCTASV